MRHCYLRGAGDSLAITYKHSVVLFPKYNKGHWVALSCQERFISSGTVQRSSTGTSLPLWGSGGGEKAPPRTIPPHLPSQQQLTALCLAGGPSDVVGCVPRLRVLHPLCHCAHCCELSPLPLSVPYNWYML